MVAEKVKENAENALNLPAFLLEKIEKISKEKKFNKAQKTKFTQKVWMEYMRSKFEPGEALGIIAAQSISEPATQMTMRTYHFAGSAGVKVTYGLPRLIEIFDAKRQPNTPIMTVHLKRQYNNVDSAKKVAEKIIARNVADLASRIVMNLANNSIEIEVEDLRKLGSVYKAMNEDTRFMRSVEKVEKKSKKISVVAKEESEIKDLQKIRGKITVMHVDGLKGVTNAVIRREDDDWVISTIGSNLEGVLNVKGVDATKTFSNDLHETKRTLGIEAARSLIINEAFNTMQQQGLDVDIRHLMIVSDTMTLSGDIRSIGRYGVAGAKRSILARAAFEETIKHLVRASIRGEIDNFEGIFENVMIGQVIPSGTGMFELIAKFDEVESDK